MLRFVQGLVGAQNLDVRASMDSGGSNGERASVDSGGTHVISGVGARARDSGQHRTTMPLQVQVQMQTQTRPSFRHTGVRYWITLWDNSLLSKAYAEFMGCMIFHFIGSVSPTAIANAVALTTLVFYTAKISGGHLNPAVTLTFCLLGHTDPLEMIVYWVAQVSGCIVGALWIAALIPGLEFKHGLPKAPFDQLIGCVQSHHDITHMQVLGWEAVGTFCFIMPVFSVVWYTQNKSGYGSTGPIMVGIALYAVALAIGDFTGALVNPARTVASDALFACEQSFKIPYFIAGQVIGASLAPLAIVPWYGLSARPWYGQMAKYMFGHQLQQQQQQQQQQPNTNEDGDTACRTVSVTTGPQTLVDTTAPFADFFLQPTADEQYEPPVYSAPVTIAEKRYTCATPVWTSDDSMTVERGGGSARRNRLRFVKTRPSDVEASYASTSVPPSSDQLTSPLPYLAMTGSVSRLQRGSMTTSIMSPRRERASTGKNNEGSVDRNSPEVILEVSRSSSQIHMQV